MGVEDIGAAEQQALQRALKQVNDGLFSQVFSRDAHAVNIDVKQALEELTKYLPAEAKMGLGRAKEFLGHLIGLDQISHKFIPPSSEEITYNGKGRSVVFNERGDKLELKPGAHFQLSWDSQNKRLELTDVQGVSVHTKMFGQEGGKEISGIQLTRQDRQLAAYVKFDGWAGAYKIPVEQASS